MRKNLWNALILDSRYDLIAERWRESSRAASAHGNGPIPVGPRRGATHELFAERSATGGGFQPSLRDAFPFWPLDPWAEAPRLLSLHRYAMSRREGWAAAIFG